ATGLRAGPGPENRQVGIPQENGGGQFPRADRRREAAGEQPPGADVPNQTRPHDDLLRQDNLTTMHKLSACVITFNDEHTVAWSVGSVQWVDEVVVVDTGSTDRTIQIAESLAARGVT